MSTIYHFNDNDFGASHTLTHKPDQAQFYLHTHAKAEIYYFVRGAGVFHIEGSAYPLESGDLLVMQSAESHYIELDLTQPYERKVLHFNTDVIRALDPQGLLLSAFFDREPGKFNLYKSHLFRGGSCEHYLDTMLQPSPDPRLSIFAGLIPLLHELYHIRAALPTQEDPAADPVEYRIMRYLNQNIDKPITLQDVCQTFYISKSQLCRVFRNSTGVTVKHYLTIKRLVKARQLMDAGVLATHVYLKCGFNDYSSFYRAYVKYYGHSPTSIQ